MKLSQKFDARRLRPRPARRWGARLLSCLAAVLVLGGLGLALLGMAALASNAPALAQLHAQRGGAALMAGAGLLVLWLGIRLWRRGRGRRRGAQGLGMSPHLMKKRD